MCSKLLNLPSQPFIIGGGEIESIEGKAQGHLTAMAIFTIAIIPLILMIVCITCQDDSSAKAPAYSC